MLNLNNVLWATLFGGFLAIWYPLAATAATPPAESKTAAVDGSPSDILCSPVTAPLNISAYNVSEGDAQALDTPVPLRITKDSKIEVVVDPDNVAKVTFEETQRQTRLASDISKIINHFAPQNTKEAQRKCTKWTYDLKYLRANVTVTAVKSDGSTIESDIVVTGPEEHLYVSFGLPVSNLSTLKYDSASGQIQPKSTSPQFYAGIGYQVGDVFGAEPSTTAGTAKKTSNSAVQWWERFNVQALVQANSKPLDSFGAAVGYTIPSNFTAFNRSLGFISLFFGHFWTKSDSMTNGVVATDSHYQGTWRAGVNFNVDAALQWVKGN